MVGFFLTPLLWFYQKQLLIPWKGKKILASKLPKVQLTNSNILFQVQNLTFAYQNPQLTFLNKSYQGALVLNNINLTINLGSFTAILGNNGSGKSTLVSCLLNLEPNFQGSVNYAGHNLKRLSPKFLAQNISYFPQTMQLPAAINVYDFVAFGRSPYQRLGLKLTSHDHSIIQQALTATDTFQFADCNLDQLSGGEKQKVFIATILAQQTNVIVLDEPNTYLDVYNQIWLMESLKKLNQLGKTIILVTHDINQAIAYASDLVVLQQGTIYQAGPTKQVVEKKLFQDVFGIDPKLVKVNNLPLITQVKLYEKPTNQINKLY